MSRDLVPSIPSLLAENSHESLDAERDQGEPLPPARSIRDIARLTLPIG
jgi:hypothetical protein